MFEFQLWLVNFKTNKQWEILSGRENMEKLWESAGWLLPFEFYMMTQFYYRRFSFLRKCVTHKCIWWDKGERNNDYRIFKNNKMTLCWSLRAWDWGCDCNLVTMNHGIEDPSCQPLFPIQPNAKNWPAGWEFSVCRRYWAGLW